MRLETIAVTEGSRTLDVGIRHWRSGGAQMEYAVCVLPRMTL